MISIISFILFIALYLLYYTSKKATLYYDLAFEKWMQKNPKPTLIIGSGLLLFGYILMLSFRSFASATLTFIIIIMVFSSLIIILKPLKKINPTFVIVFSIISALVEFYYS